MSRRRYGRRRGPRKPLVLGPSVYVDDMAIVALTPLIHSIAVVWGVASGDVPDVIQDVLLGAWAGMSAGRFRAREGYTIPQALRAWVAVIAMNHALKWHERAHVRRVRPYADPWRGDEPVWDPEPMLDAREALTVAAKRLPRKLLPVFVLMKRSATLTEIGIALGTTIPSAWRLRCEVRRRLASIAEGRG